MDKIVDLKDRIDRQKQRKVFERDREKFEPILKVIQCSSCNFRCAMCGVHINDPEQARDSLRSLGHSFCESCRMEFEDYLTVIRGEGSNIFWHNKEWIRMWASWVEHRHAIKAFMNSPEFRLLSE